MAEAIITRTGSVATSELEGFGYALIRVSTNTGRTLTCTNDLRTFTKTCGDSGIVEFSVGYGKWTITTGASSIEVNVENLQIYNVDLTGNRTYGIKIDTTNTNPANAVTYTDDAIGFTPLSVNQSTGACNYGSWGEQDFMENFLGCRPCLYKNGTRVSYLNPNDYSKFTNGTTADITSGNAGDVMVEFKKCWYKFSKVGNNIYFQIADYDRSKDGFVTTAFTDENNGAAVNYMYYGAYEGYNDGNKWRSLSGKTNTISITYTNTRTYCKNNGIKYGMENWTKRWYILGLLMLVTKGRDMSSTIGQGRWQQSSAIQTGTMNNRGLFYGRSIYTEGVKCFGIENMWGNYWNWVDGVVTASNALLFKGTAPYNDTGSGYSSVSDGFTRNGWYTATNMMPVLNGAAMTATVGQSNHTIGWADGWYVSSGAGEICFVGGCYDNGSNVSCFLGPFAFGVSSNPGSSNYSHVGRLVAA